jgi:hypothetical protein
MDTLRPFTVPDGPGALILRCLSASCGLPDVAPWQTLCSLIVGKKLRPLAADPVWFFNRKWGNDSLAEPLQPVVRIDGIATQDCIRRDPSNHRPQCIAICTDGIEETRQSRRLTQNGRPVDCRIDPGP